MTPARDARGLGRITEPEVLIPMTPSKGRRMDGKRILHGDRMKMAVTQQCRHGREERPR